MCLQYKKFKWVDSVEEVQGNFCKDTSSSGFSVLFTYQLID